MNAKATAPQSGAVFEIPCKAGGESEACAVQGAKAWRGEPGSQHAREHAAALDAEAHSATRPAVQPTQQPLCAATGNAHSRGHCSAASQHGQEHVLIWEPAYRQRVAGCSGHWWRAGPVRCACVVVRHTVHAIAQVVRAVRGQCHIWDPAHCQRDAQRHMPMQSQSSQPSSCVCLCENTGVATNPKRHVHAEHTRSSLVPLSELGSSLSSVSA